jgi:hypothetical protein
MTEQEVDAFVGKNAEYYKEKWKAHPNSQYFKGWNGIAFVFFLEWAAYRRMYKEALLAFLGILIFGIFFSLIPIGTDFFGELCGQAIKLFLSFFANGLYRRKALRMVNISLNMPENIRMDYLAKKGGVNITGVIVCVILEIAPVFLPGLLYRIL